MPPWVEPAGIVYAEAASAGLPSIGTTEGGASDIIGDAGRLVHPAGEDGLVEALRALADPQVACRLGQVAQQRAQLSAGRRSRDGCLVPSMSRRSRRHGLSPFRWPERPATAPPREALP
jgi:glycosyltransferase involved in cell wall biosynthesis